MTPITTKTAPEAIGPYSQAMVCGQTVYLSGQIALDPLTMELCSSDIVLQIEQVLKNLAAVCHAAGGNLNCIAKLSVYLTDLSYFSLVNEAMTHHFTAPYPARAVIEVSALPKGALVEMDGVMYLPD
ncbi:MAG: reactive intermediate/imine deaminase [Legionella sp.]|nr:MAG: reactive intermediate/imine deaminase [Legionella sp.]PJD99403.1 MAG: reactive intermediate/imine deaminase [Legionella sp.]